MTTQTPIPSRDVLKSQAKTLRKDMAARGHIFSQGLGLRFKHVTRRDWGLGRHISHSCSRLITEGGPHCPSIREIEGVIVSQDFTDVRTAGA